MSAHTDHAAPEHTTVGVADLGKEIGQDLLDQPALLLDYGSGVLCIEGAPQDLLALTHRLWAAAATLAMPRAHHQFLITVAATDPATDTIVRRLIADLTEQVSSDTPLRITVHRQ